MHLNESPRWKQRIFTGDWVAGRGEAVPVIEPATGEQLALLATASADEIGRASCRERV